MRVLVATVAVVLCPALACADSLGGAARQEAQRRNKPRAAEAKVYAEGDLARNTSAPAEAKASSAEPPPTHAAGATGANAAARSSEEQLRRDLERDERARLQKETYWRQAAADCRARVANAQRSYDTVCAGGTRLTGG